MNKIKVLVVEDQAVVREGVVAILSFSPDIEVVGQAENGAQALAMVKTKKPDVILLDLVMPQMDGLTAIPRIKEINPDAKVLLASGYSINGQASKIMERGCDGFIQKPFTLKQLSTKIREILDGGKN